MKHFHFFALQNIRGAFRSIILFEILITLHKLKKDTIRN